MDVEQGAALARLCAINLIAQMQAALGSLDRVEQHRQAGRLRQFAPRISPDQPEVGNGASDLMVAVFGDAGRHARSAVGVAVLPRGVGVEIDAIVAIKS